jgi:hypothetical protein
MTITDTSTADAELEELTAAEALRELAEENEDLRDELAEAHRGTTLCIRILSDLIGEAYPNGVTAASELRGHLRKLLDAGHRVEFSKGPDGYVATIGDHDAIAASPAAALDAVAEAISGEDPGT